MIYYSDDYVAAEHDFDTTRKAALVAEQVFTTPPLPKHTHAAEDLLVEVHDVGYVADVCMNGPRADSSGIPWSRGHWHSVLASSAGCVAAAERAIEGGFSGTLSSGLHHAKYDRGDGYCTFNGLVLAAMHALNKGAERILILDLDAHAGGGTNELLLRHRLPVFHADLVVSKFDDYNVMPTTGVKAYADPNNYLQKLDYLLSRIDIGWDLIIYNAGVDPVNVGVDKEDVLKREIIVANWARLSPIMFTLAGGYSYDGWTRQGIADLHVQTIRALSEKQPKSAFVFRY